LANGAAPAPLPPVIVKPERTLVIPGLMRNTRLELLPEIVRPPANPEALIVILLLSVTWLLVSVMVLPVRFAPNMTVEPEGMVETMSRNDPGPLSLVVFTVDEMNPT